MITKANNIPELIAQSKKAIMYQMNSNDCHFFLVDEIKKIVWTYDEKNPKKKLIYASNLGIIG